MARLILLVLCISSVALAFPEPPDGKPWYLYIFKSMMKNFPEMNAWFGAAMVFLMGLFRSLSELLLFISKKTETKTDDKLAATFAKIVRWLGKIIGWFGLGKSKK